MEKILPRRTFGPPCLDGLALLGRLRDRCRKFFYRAGRKAAHVEALIRDYNAEHDCFRCHYTHIVLEENDRKSHKCLTFDHLIPGLDDIDNLVITFAMYNEEKTDMTYDEHVAFDKLGGKAVGMENGTA